MKKRAVVVDDERVVGKLAKNILEGQMGYRVEYFENPLNALEHTRDCGPIDLFLTDYQMPQMNGLELAKRATEVNPEIRRVIISSGCSPSAKLLKEIAERGFEFLKKPYIIAALREAATKV